MEKNTVEKAIFYQKLAILQYHIWLSNVFINIKKINKNKKDRRILRV